MRFLNEKNQQNYAFFQMKKSAFPIQKMKNYNAF